MKFRIYRPQIVIKNPLKNIFTTLAYVFQPAPAFEIFKTNGYIALKIIWLIVVFATWAYMAKDIIELTKEFIAENLGTRTSFESVDVNFVQSHFRFIFCPAHWVSEEKLELLGFGEQEKAYLFSYLTSEVKPIGNFSKITRERVDSVAKKYGGLKELFEELVLNKSTVTGLDMFFLFSGPLLTHMCSTLRELQFYAAPLGSITTDVKVALNLTNETMRFSRLDQSYYTHYGGEHLGALSSAMRNIYLLDHKQGRYVINIRHFIHFNGRKHKCLENHPTDFLPVGYARDYCAFRCVDKSIYNAKYNCTVLLLTEPSFAPPGLRQCNYLDPNMANFVTDVANQLPVLEECVRRDHCNRKRFCHEWEVRRSLVQYQVPCYDSTGKQHEQNICDEHQVTLWIDDRIETLEEYPLRTLNNVVSDYGGQLSLWVGVSMIGMLQFGMHWCIMCATPRRRRRSGSRHRSLA